MIVILVILEGFGPIPDSKFLVYWFLVACLGCMQGNTPLKGIPYLRIMALQTELQGNSRDVFLALFVMVLDFPSKSAFLGNDLSS